MRHSLCVYGTDLVGAQTHSYMMSEWVHNGTEESRGELDYSVTALKSSCSWLTLWTNDTKKCSISPLEMLPFFHCRGSLTGIVNSIRTNVHVVRKKPDNSWRSLFTFYFTLIRSICWSIWNWPKVWTATLNGVDNHSRSATFNQHVINDRIWSSKWAMVPKYRPLKLHNHSISHSEFFDSLFSLRTGSLWWVHFSGRLI